MVSYQSFKNPKMSQSYKYRWSSFATMALMICSFDRIHGCHFHTTLYLAAKPITQQKYKMILRLWNQTNLGSVCLSEKLPWKSASHHWTKMMVPFPIDEWTLTEWKKVVVPKPTNGGLPGNRLPPTSIRIGSASDPPGVSGRILMNWPEAGDSCWWLKSGRQTTPAWTWWLGGPSYLAKFEMFHQPRFFVK